MSDITERPWNLDNGSEECKTHNSNNNIMRGTKRVCDQKSITKTPNKQALVLVYGEFGSNEIGFFGVLE